MLQYLILNCFNLLFTDHATWQSRADACLSQLRELNASVAVDVLAPGFLEDLQGVGPLSSKGAQVLSAYSCVVVCDKNRPLLEKVGKYCHDSG